MGNLLHLNVELKYEHQNMKSSTHHLTTRLCMETEPISIFFNLNDEKITQLRQVVAYTRVPSHHVQINAPFGWEFHRNCTMNLWPEWFYSIFIVRIKVWTYVCNILCVTLPSNISLWYFVLPRRLTFSHSIWTLCSTVYVWLRQSIIKKFAVNKYIFLSTLLLDALNTTKCLRIFVQYVKTFWYRFLTCF